ncbi:TetR family transcriptional regulator [Glycomyces fuscus]|nr:TetR family transcriptional regulator [Glycomyces fuscus]
MYRTVMNDRRQALLDAALRVLAAQGMRGLTHRAVDTEAGLPSSSCNYYFRSRAALVGGCVDRLLELERADHPAVAEPSSAEELYDALADDIVTMVTVDRGRLLARYELHLAAARDPQLRQVMRRASRAADQWDAQQFAAHGITDSEAAAAGLSALIDGLVFTALLQDTEDPEALRVRARAAIAAHLTLRTAGASR